jgi:hypothetical protein
VLAGPLKLKKRKGEKVRFRCMRLLQMLGMLGMLGSFLLSSYLWEISMWKYSDSYFFTLLAHGAQAMYNQCIAYFFLPAYFSSAASKLLR